MNPTQMISDFLEKVPFTLLLAAFLGYLGYGYYQFTSDSASPLHTKQGEIEAAKDDVAKLQKRVREVSEFLHSLSAKKQELRQLAIDLENTKATISESLDSADLMNTIYTEALRSGLTVSDLKPVGKETKEFYEANDFAVNASGVFFQYVAFLDRIGNLQKIVRVDDIKFTPTGSADAPFVRLKAEMKIQAYRYLGSKADELGRAANSDTSDSTGPAAAKKGGP